MLSCFIYRNDGLAAKLGLTPPEMKDYEHEMRLHELTPEIPDETSGEVISEQLPRQIAPAI